MYKNHAECIQSKVWGHAAVRILWILALFFKPPRVEKRLGTALLCTSLLYTALLYTTLPYALRFSAGKKCQNP